MKHLKTLTTALLCTAVFACGTLFSACTPDNGESNNGDNGQENTQGGKRYLEFTEDYDFENLKSDTVTEEQWRATFNADNYISYTIKVRQLSKQQLTKKTMYIHTQTAENGDFKRHIGESDRDDYDQYVSNADGSYTSYIKKNSEWLKYPISAEDATSDMINTFNNWYRPYTMACPDFGEFYSSFEYDDDKGAYVLNNIVKTNSILEYWDVNYYTAEVKIIDNKLAYLYVTLVSEDSNHTKIYFYDYENTEVELPEAQEMQMGS